MGKEFDDILKKEVEKYNELNKQKKALESEFGKVNQEMLKILGKIELLKDLKPKDKNE
tara:strand:+ start:437 stop:610 length:174 start_codon:yes stop_codon:yes gene_type:complete